MNLFEQLKSLPKIDLHINFTSSISEELLYDPTNLNDVMESFELRDYNYKDKDNSLKELVSILKNKNIINKAINNLIDRLINDNVIYSELYVDLNLYKKVNLENLIKMLIETINNRNYNMNLVLCLSSKFDKEENIEIINIYNKYKDYVKYLYFDKDNYTNLSDYNYIFDRLVKENIPYILNLNTKMNNQDKDIYLNSNRIIYCLDNKDDILINDIKEHKILLEFGVSDLFKEKVVNELKDYFIYDLYQNNVLITFVTKDMTLLNTDILNELCIIFNSYPLTIHDIIKIGINNLINCNIEEEKRKELINNFKDKCNIILDSLK